MNKSAKSELIRRFSNLKINFLFEKAHYDPNKEHHITFFIKCSYIKIAIELGTVSNTKEKCILKWVSDDKNKMYINFSDRDIEENLSECVQKIATHIINKRTKYSNNTNIFREIIGLPKLISNHPETKEEIVLEVFEIKEFGKRKRIVDLGYKEPPLLVYVKKEETDVKKKSKAVNLSKKEKMDITKNKKEGVIKVKRDKDSKALAAARERIKNADKLYEFKSNP